MSSPLIAPGAHIELRDVVWRVVRVDQTSSGKAAWRCVGVSEIVRDREALFLEEFEPKVKVLDPRTTTLVPDTSSGHRAGLLYIESLLRDVPPTDDAIHVGQLAAMDSLPYQLEPAHKALQKPRARILIADAVGLGKTLEAGILLSELIRRGRGRRILVAATKSMLTQFQKEMWARFTIPLVRLDTTGLQRVRARIPTHHNPFHHFDRVIISIDTLKQNNAFARHVETATWDVIVIDEAHNVAARGNARSQRARVAEVLAENCDHLILLSATPHDGRAESFASLMNMLDPTAIADPRNYGPDDIRGLFVRRFRKDVAAQLKGSVPERQVFKVWCAATEAEEATFDVLTRLDFTESGGQAHGGGLFRTTLEKALFSSPAACLETIQQRIGNLGKRIRPERFANDISELRRLERAVQSITADQFGKFQRLVAYISESKWSPRKRDDRLVIFTERRKTLEFLSQHLPKALKLKPQQVEVLHGGLSDKEQQRIVEDFGRDKAKVRLLLASDVASEGINLHFASHRLIHFDVPWSLMVFQQRNGRIDRYGQTEQPQIVYLLTQSTHERIKGDARILETLIAKDEQAKDNIADPSAFMNVYDIEAEEQITAAAMDQGLSADEFGARLDGNAAGDPFAAMLLEAQRLAGEVSEDGPAPEPVRTEAMPSLFEDDYAFVETALEHLRRTEDVRSVCRPSEKLIELEWPDDLRRRYGKLPTEVRPKDGVVLLTSDRQRMQKAIADARKEETAWPRHQLLWANSPIVEWIADRMRGGFGKHGAPVLRFPGLGDDAAVIVSGLLPNQRSQPLVHRWYAVRFTGDAAPEVEPFVAFARRVGFGDQTIPNREEPIDVTSLKALLGPAIDAAEARIAVDRRAFDARNRPLLDEELARLGKLRARQLSFLEESLAGSRKAHQRARRVRRAERLFADHMHWIKDAMTPAKRPFVQVIAVLAGGAR